MTLPDCPFCDSNATLKAEASEGSGVILANCSCCGRDCRVKDGVVVHRPSVLETQRKMQDADY